MTDDPIDPPPPPTQNFTISNNGNGVADAVTLKITDANGVVKLFAPDECGGFDIIPLPYTVDKV